MANPSRGTRVLATAHHKFGSLDKVGEQDYASRRWSSDVGTHKQLCHRGELGEVNGPGHWGLCLLARIAKGIPANMGILCCQAKVRLLITILDG